MFNRHSDYTSPRRSVTQGMLSSVKRATNFIIQPLGLEIVRKDRHDWSDTRNFIPFAETLEASRQTGMTIGDYIDTVIAGTPGATENTIRNLQSIGVFSHTIETAVEIGPGSGRYLEKVVAVCAPKRYEIYETSAPWASYLAREYKVIVQPTDGRSLAATRNGSCNLVQAYKVFSSIPFLTSLRYWAEMLRVASPGGYIIFDVLTETCLGGDTINQWIESDIDNGSFPASIPRATAIEYFSRGGCDFLESFLVPIGKGYTETFVFRKI